MAKKEKVRESIRNRKAFHDYHILEKYEAGIELQGTEVKSIRGGDANLRDNYAQIKDGEVPSEVWFDEARLELTGAKEAAGF